MALMTGAQYIESLRKLNTRVYMFGEKIDNWVDHPIIRPSINCVAVTYDLAHDAGIRRSDDSNFSYYRTKRSTVSHISTRVRMICSKKVKMQRLLRTEDRMPVSSAA